MKLIYILLFAIVACTTSKNVINNKIETIVFGSGGGFTGVVTTYSLSADGHLNIVERNKNISVKTVDKKTVKELFEKANELKSYQFNVPENVYSFLEIQTKENKQNITWGFGSTKVDSRVTTLYNELMSLIKKSKS
jgi:hypothetical protein